MQRTLKGITLALALAAIAGCSTQSGSQAQVTTSGFDGAKVVSIRGHGNACTGFICTGLGAHWDSKTPDTALLVVYLFNDIKGITGAQLNIDGKTYNLERNAQLTNFNEPGSGMQESRKGFIVPLDLIRKIVTSNRVWLRVQTTGGYAEDAIYENGKDSRSYNALKRFLASVDQAG